MAAPTGERLSPKDRIDCIIQENDVIIFSKTTCPYCSRAKAALKEEGVDFAIFELDELPPEEAAAMQDSLRDMTGARTVPRIFVRGECIGGCDDLLALQSAGQLTALLKSGSSASKWPAPKPDFKMTKSEKQWAEELGPKQYHILRRQGTESPGSHEFSVWMPKQGHFACAGCGLPLYSADSKFKSSCGWPVFDKCYYSEDAGGCHVGIKPDMGSYEIVCSRCDSHLGHVFFDSFSAKNPNGERH